VPSLKSVKGGKTDDTPEVRTITLRGVEYKIREATVPEYKESLKAATDEKTGFTPFGELLEALTMRLVSPSPLASSKPMSYPIYRRLEGIVNEMHFTDIESDEEKAAAEGEDEDEAVEEELEAAAPNS
jgi:hypothetical protein